MTDTNYYKATFADGSVMTRSSKTRGYSFAYSQDVYPREGWTSRADLIPARAQYATAEKITAEEFEAIRLAARVEGAGSLLALKLDKARATLFRAQWAQEQAFDRMRQVRETLAAERTPHHEDVMRWATGGCSAEEAARIGRPVKPIEDCVAQLTDRMVDFQRDQALAYGRIAKAIREIAKLEAQG
jgi:hypothetical protein